MSSPAKRFSRTAIQLKPKNIAKEIPGRRRSYSNGDTNAHALSRCSETNVSDLSRDWLDGSDVKTGSPLKQMTLMVLESIMRKYELEKSDLDAFKDMGLVADNHVEIEELCNLALYAWNLEEILFEEKEETTDSRDEYFALLERYQKRSHRPRSNTTGSCHLTSKNDENFGDKFKENIEGTAEQSIKGDLKRGAETQLKENSKTKVHENKDPQIVITHGERQDEEDPERTNHTPTKVQEVTIEQQRTDGQLNSADLGSQESIQSDKSNRESRESKSIHSDEAINKQSFQSSSVSLTTTVWLSDHTYCLTWSPTKPEEYGEKGVAMVIPNKDKVGQIETSDSRDINKTREVPNKEDPNNDTSPGNVKARDANIPYKEIHIKTERDETDELLSGRQDSDIPRDIPYKAGCKKNESRTTGSEAETRGEDKPRNNSSIESRDPDNPCDNTLNMKNVQGKNNRVKAEESQLDMNETPGTPKKKIRKEADNSKGAGKTRSRDTTKPRDSTPTRDHSQSQDSTKSRDSTQANGRTESRDSIRPRDGLQSPPPKSDQCNTPSPLRRSKRTKQPTPRRLDTYYY